MNAPATQRVTVMQGEMQVSGDPNLILTTVLGSCIAACLYEPDIRIGGLNHFLLAEPGSADTDPRSQQRYGVYAMEMLINAMLKRGAARCRLRARIYGGASLHPGLRDIGATNAAFARAFLRDERITLVGEDIGGNDARRVEFRPTLGLARCRCAARIPQPEPRPIASQIPVDSGEVELF